MLFRTELNLSGSPHKITHSKPVVFVGSCFSSNIGQKLYDDKFNTLINPFGTLYNPVSISRCIIQSMAPSMLLEDDFITVDGIYHHYDYHSDLSDIHKNKLIEKIDQCQSSTKKMISEASHIFITLGSAFVFERKSNQKIVANCHKQPGFLFDRRFLDRSEIIDHLLESVSLIKGLNSAIKIILTVSPVRHVRDGLIDNSRSKALLIDTCHCLCDQSASVEYFPAFEIMMDDLRDYRFYQRDLIHPNEQAIEYIYEKFERQYFTHETLNLISTVNKITQAVSHRPFNRASDAHQEFLKNTLAKIDSVEKQYPIDMTAERKKIQEGLLN